MSLIATSRESRASRARYTSPIPPAPSQPTISYGPMVVPIAIVMAAAARRPWEKPARTLEIS
jgi:hypothetical protein